MSICHGCGGIIGRDCFNPIECEQITRSMAAAYQTQPDYQRQIDELTISNQELLEVLKDAIKVMESASNVDQSIFKKIKSVINAT